MRRFPLVMAAALVAAASADAQFFPVPPTQVQPLPFTPYVPPVACSGLVGRTYINCVIPDIRVLAGASYYNTAFEPIYNRLYGPKMILRPATPVEPLPPPRPPIDPERAVVTLHVPEIAEVWIEGRKMAEPGATRQFITPKLQESRTYFYDVVVRWNDGKKPVEQKVRVPVAAGERPVVMVLPQ